MENCRVPLIIVFAKAPIPSQVKTRLIPSLGADAACRLHQAFVEDTLSSLRELAVSCDVELHIDCDLPDWRPGGVSQRLQSSGDLGNRMYVALSGALKEGRPAAAILGSDSPTLPLNYVTELLNSPADICLGPTSDGGFYAISCRRTDPEMFAGVEWSTAKTRMQTVAASRLAGLTVGEGSEWYDVDTKEDLDRLIADFGLRPCTQRALMAEGLMPDTHLH
ncbi:MAG: TIGR04282 family arsenosugar biosynthesis glycosyltransferase [Bryobacteraceae bacterium]